MVNDYPPLTDEELRLLSRNIPLVGWSDVPRLIAELQTARVEAARRREDNRRLIAEVAQLQRFIRSGMADPT